MKRKVLSVLIGFISLTAFGQQKFTDREYKAKMEWKKGNEVICPASHIDENTFRDIPEEIKLAIAANNRLRPGATNAAKFNVLYDPEMPQVAQDAFQRAVDIWSELLNSDVDIEVIALWQDLGPSVLGSASPGTYYRNFAGAGKVNTWYPIALAEKMSGQALNSPEDFDIVARFSSAQNWYYGTTGTPAVGQFDFTSVVLHELCHGLGFVGSLGVEGTQGYYGLGTDIPVIFDTFVQNEKDQNVVDTTLFPNPSTALRNELISENLFYNSPLAVGNNNGDKISLYAPTIFDSGSSIFHLDDNTYPAGTVNSLMTPTAGIREINYDVGPIVMDIFTDMGWKSSSIIHTPVKDIETATEVTINVTIFSDTSLVDGSAILNYISLDTETGTIEERDNGLLNPTKVPLIKGEGNKFSAVIPITDPTSLIFYFITASDNLGNNMTSPPSAPELYWLFEVGSPDIAGPSIEYYPPTIVVSGSPINFVANVEDAFEAGIDTVYVNYAINGVDQTPFGLRKYNADTDAEFSQGGSDEIAYLMPEGIPALEENDVVTLSMTAVDKAGNSTTIPTTAGGTSFDSPVVPDVYEFVATTLLETISEAFLDFEEDTEAFASTGFNILTPSGLSNGALQTESPYKNGLGLYDPTFGTVALDFDYNAIALYRHPILISTDSATISFDEIVMVEGGDEGFVFGEEGFWDYVIVEGSLDFGGSWFSLTDGYDANSDDAWSELFNSSLTPANAEVPTSNGTPSPALYRTREINIYDALLPEAAGSEMLLRFRLYADQWVNGWGWAIDNLSIQKPVAKALASEAALFDMTLSPNPTVNHIDVKARMAQAKTAKVEIFQINGIKVYDKDLELEDNALEHRIDTHNYDAGSYIVKLKTEGGEQSKRFVINR
ncbi:T9SS type A sorting domain-containing protein [Arcticibacterium luteifluviistationis]|uniref:Secretion system C-terminal sorting domain-containing protein n=1 Tax=Arcticibacterium luteifluviistationis TaxID=1784714 RepID=A0A2Z4GC61_9BACT|nr:T9SS type A sorting domain-containing protein [Arcticibacterium luteifluviistationis]AWV98648.1 hypothetical protein DJ013_10895 [Arcticibacterium luteifluviistationis]